MIRTRFLDYDARRDPKTDRYCSLCQRDVSSDRPAHAIWLNVEDMHITHPEDASGKPNALLGRCCAKQIGMEWSINELL